MSAESNESTAILLKVMRIAHLKAFQTPKISFNWNRDLDNPHDSEDDWEADNESDMELDNGSEVSETLEVQNVSAARNVSVLIEPIRHSKKKVEKVLLTDNIMETRRDKGIKKKEDRMHQCIITKFIM
jgi:hypothetical protein